MSRLKNYNGRFCESDFEAAFISYLEATGWQYLPGASIPRASKRDVLKAQLKDICPILIKGSLEGEP